MLRLGPAKPNGGYRTSSGAKFFSWGGAVVEDSAGEFHLYASEWTRGCGLEYWTPNSRVVRATASNVDGPYVFAQEVLPTFYTNPQLVSLPNGQLLLYVIGQPCNKTADCTNSTHPPSKPFHYTCRYHNDMQSGISLFSSGTGPLGPWRSHGMILNGSGSANGGGFNNSRTNPTALVEPDGSILLNFRGGSKGYRAEFLGSARASSWADSYHVTSPKPLLPENLEDPFVYKDCRGGYHMLAHSIGRSSHGVGVHMHSADGKTWIMGTPAVAYTTEVAWSDGTTSMLERRERPVLVFKKNHTSGCNWIPIALINGALNRTQNASSSSPSEEDVEVSDFKNTPTFTLIQPVVSRSKMFDEFTDISLARARTASKTDDDMFSVHVPLYDLQLSPKSPEMSKLLWAAEHVPLSVAMCGSFHGCAAIDQCCHAEENEQAAKILRVAGVTVLHYVPTMRLPATASPKCCNSMTNITQMVVAALASNASDGIYFDVVAGLNEPAELPFFRALHGLVQNHRPNSVPRPVMFNPSTPSFLEAYVKLDGVRVNAFESTVDHWSDANSSRLFDWSRFSRRRFAMVTEKAANIEQMATALQRATASTALRRRTPLRLALA
eukprot:COSAG02_NODE_369_length_23680_cov_36.650609_10_plen_608_part_00